MTTVVTRSMAWPSVLARARTSDKPPCGRSSDFDGDVGRVRERVEHGGALLGLGHERLDVLLGGVRVDRERHLDVVKAVADVAVGTEDAADVVRALRSEE